MDKHTLRNTLVEQRNALSANFVTEASHAICKQLLELPELKCKPLASYCAIGNEVDLSPLNQHLWSTQKSLYLPRILSMTAMEWALTESAGDLTEGRFGIPTSARAETCATERLSTLIMPCTGFDRALNRLGMGGGFYDRTLAETQSGPLRIGVAFSCQEWAHIPTDAWDQPFDILVTEREIIRP